MNDRQTIEVMLPSLIVREIIRDVRQIDHDDPRTIAMCDACEADLTDAATEPLMDKKDRADKLARRADRALRATMKMARGWHFASVVMATRLLTERLIGQGHLVLYADTPFDRAWTRFVEAIESSEEAKGLDVPERRGEADRLMRAMRCTLEAYGYYRTREMAA